MRYQERKHRQDKTKRNIEIVGISVAIFSAILFVLACLPLGNFSGFFLGVFGVAVYPIFVLVSLFGIGMFLSRRYYLQKRYFVYLILNFVCLACLLHVAIGHGGFASASIRDYGTYLSNCFHRTSGLTVGGVICGVVTYPIVCLLGVVGTCIFFAILLCVFIGLAADFMFAKRNKLTRKDKERNMRVLSDESTNGYDTDYQALSQDYETRARKIVPKRFEKEDYDRYVGVQSETDKSADYYGSMLFSSRGTSSNSERLSENTFDVSVREESAEEASLNKGPEANDFDFEDQSNIEKQDGSSAERARVHELLFGNKTETSEKPVEVETTTKTFDDNEKYPSKYDPNSFVSKKDYIMTPILPGYLNKKEIDRQTILERNREILAAKQREREALQQTREPVSNFEQKQPQFDFEGKQHDNLFAQQDRVRDMSFITDDAPAKPVGFEPVKNIAQHQEEYVDTEDDGDDEIPEQKPAPIFGNMREKSFDVSPLQEKKQPVLDDDSLDGFLPKQTFSADTFVDPLEGRDFVQREPLHHGRGPDLAQRKSPERQHPAFAPQKPQLSDMVEEERPQDRLQKQFGTNASVVAPSPSFLDSRKQQSTNFVQNSLINEPKPSFGVEKKPPVDTKYVAPDPRILTTNSDDPAKYGGDTQAKSRILEETLDSFRIGAKVTHVVKGPSVTRYELSIPAGIPVRKLANYESNIAMTLMSKNGVRLELPIPGKNAVGVEVPNDAPCTVGLRDMILSREFQSASGALPVAIGKNISGEYVVQSLAKMVHLLVAGSTGSGKSVFLHNLILSLMFKSSPEQLRFIMVDPKRVEFTFYNGMPHMMLPNVVTECDKAVNALAWATKEMDRRYRMFQQHLVNNIETYNKCPEVLSGEEKKIPYIVIVIDELADLMMVASKEVERHIQRIAQLGRACGIHLVIATQRPTVQYVTGTIKANLPTRVAFALTSAIDSKTILDEGGAEKLIGRGDMLFSPQGSSAPTRLQAAYASTEEVKAVVQYIKDHNACYFDEEAEKEIMAEPEAEKEVVATDNKGENVDEFFYPALRLFIETGNASTTMIQRRFGVGFARAARLVDQMELKGYVSPQNGSKKRNVYITMDQYRELSGDED